MGDEGELRDTTETAASSPSQHEQDGGGKGGLKAAKDRHCPFCAQAFTSSSLGRHLDLYIKPKNPKPPDGMHDVTEIRKIRSGITRRQARSGTKHSVSEAGSRQEKEQTPSRNPRSPSRAEQEAFPLESPAQTSHRYEAFQPGLIPTSWQATGVIPNLPPRSASRNGDVEVSTAHTHAHRPEPPPTGQAHRIQEMRRNVRTSKNQRSERDNESIWQLQEAAEMGRITELALREVLGSLEAANKRNESAKLFDDVDFFSLSFPGLCLAILPPPTTLFSPTPFASPESWTLSPPSRRQFEVLNRMSNSRIEEVRKDNSNAFSASAAFRYSAHIAGAYEHWKENMSDADRSLAWNLELCRSYATAMNQKRETSRQLDACKHRLGHLEGEYDRLSRCQLPREFLLHPPQTMPAPLGTMKEVKATQSGAALAEMNYDADAIIEKWRSTVKATTRRNLPPPLSESFPSGGYDIPECNKSCGNHPISGDMIMNGAVVGIGGPIGPLVDKNGDQRSVNYETPPQPGHVVEVENEAAGGEPDEEQGDFGHYLGKGVPPKYLYGGSHFRPGGIGVVNTSTNGNGKRPLEPDIMNGGGKRGGNGGGTKISKERHIEPAVHHRQKGREEEEEERGDAFPQQQEVAEKKSAFLYPGSWLFNEFDV